MKNTGTNNRTKGHNAERLYAKIFREELGYDKCVTTRNSSRLLDSCKVDLDFIPFKIQIKAGKQKNLNYSKVLKEVEDMVKIHFPASHTIHDYPSLIVHHKNCPQGKKREDYDTLVIITFETFKKLIKNYDRK